MRGSAMVMLAFLIVGDFRGTQCSAQTSEAGTVQKLQDEIGGKGWIAYCSRGDNGTWDLFLCRPDGSEKRNFTNTPEYEEAAPRFSPDGKRILYRRLEKGATINHDQWGFQGQLIIAQSDGSKTKAFGGEGDFPWSDWSRGE